MKQTARISVPRTLSSHRGPESRLIRSPSVEKGDPFVYDDTGRIDSQVATFVACDLQGIRPLFSLVDSADAKNSVQSIAHLYQGGLGLPDRDFYILPEKEEIRGKYKEHLKTVFKLLGKSDEEAQVRTMH
jgi:predicted metalloendopeptidase